MTPLGVRNRCAANMILNSDRLNLKRTLSFPPVCLMTPPRTSPRLSATFLSPKPRSYVAVREYPACLISPYHSCRTGARGSPLSTVHARVRNPHRGSFCSAEVRLHWQAANAHGEKSSTPGVNASESPSELIQRLMLKPTGEKCRRQGEPLPGHETHPALCFSFDHSVKRLSPCGEGTSVCYQSEFHARDEVNGGA